MSQEKQRFLYPPALYRGSFSPEQLLFNANLQEFAQRVEYISCLHTGGKMSSEEAVQEISTLWKILVSSKPKRSTTGGHA